MNVVDSSGWLEHFAASANATHFSPIIKNTEQLIVPVITIYEVFKRLLSYVAREEAGQAVQVMMNGTVVDLNIQIALLAAEMSTKYKLPMADSIILATANVHHATLWTQDAHFKGLANVQFIEKK